MSLGGRLKEIHDGFERPFWVANVSELFERLSYYAAFASLARYLHETLSFPAAQASRLTGLFGGLVWFLAAFGGTLADRLGFRRSLSLAYFILSCSYFLLGSLGSSWLAPVRRRRASLVAGGFCIDAAGAGDCASQTLCGGNNRARLKRERPLPRLLHLLHAREYRRGSGTVHGLLGTPTYARGKRLSCRCVKCISDVFCGFIAVQGTSAV